MLGRKLTDTQKDLIRRLRMILSEDWDPISRHGFNVPPDEYDEYVLQVFRRAIEKADAQEIAEYLLGVERERMGLVPNAELALRAAKALVEEGAREGGFE